MGRLLFKALSQLERLPALSGALLPGSGLSSCCAHCVKNQAKTRPLLIFNRSTWPPQKRYSLVWLQ